MISQAGGHRRRPSQPFVAADQSRQAETLVLSAEVVNATDQEHAAAQAPAVSGEGACATRQAVQGTAKGRVEALDEGGVEFASALRRLDQGGDRFFGPAQDVAPHSDDAMALVLLDDLPDQELRPEPEPTTPGLLTRFLLAEDLQQGRRIARQAIDAEQDRSTQGRGAAFDPAERSRNQLMISLCAHLSAQPQPGRDHQRHRHPDDGPLRFDPQFVTLHLPQLQRLLDQVLVNQLGVLPTARQPLPDRPLIKPEGRDNRSDRAPMSEQRDDQRDQIGRFPQPIKGRPAPGAEGLAALPAEVAPFLLRMHPNVALAGLSSGRAVKVGAKCRLWGQRRSFILIGHKEIVVRSQSFFKDLSPPRLNVELPPNLYPKHSLHFATSTARWSLSLSQR